MLKRELLLLMCLLILLLSEAEAQRLRIPRRHDKPPGPPISAEEAVKKMTVPDGFSVEIVAAEPDIVNPVGMTIDERGRFWIVESLEYPRRSPGPGRDRVKVLEDTDGDGKADSVTIFAEGLNIPSGIAVGHGGVWVANAPDILFLQDADGDGKADKREVVVTGFGRRDTHELPNSFVWGPDGWLYGLNGVFNHSHVKYPESNPNFDPAHPGWPITCAVFRIHPKTREFQVFAEGTSNPWGIAWDTEGSAFLSACVIDHLWHITETGYYHRQGGPYPPHTWKLESIVEHKHQKAAYCGIHHFNSDAYPEQYRDVLYMGNIHGGCINADVVERRGATYFGKPRPDFLTANDAWFMPVAQKTGPDGCLYVLDWYDRYHCYQDANADPDGIDRLRGRLYRVRYRDTPHVANFDLSRESDDQLIERLQAHNDYLRWTAQRLLAERDNDDTRAKLEELLLAEKTPHDVRLQALWTIAQTRNLRPDLHRRLLTHEDASLRAWAVRFAGMYDSLSDGPLFDKVPPAIWMLIAELADDPSPDVRVQVAIAARKLRSVDPLPLLTRVLIESENDPIIPQIVWANLHPLLEKQSDEFVAGLANARLSEAGALPAILPRALARILDRRPPALEEAGRLFAITADADNGDVSTAQQCLAMLSGRVQNGEIKGEQLDALRKSMAATLSRLIGTSTDHPLYLDAALLATSWKDPAGLQAVRNVLTSAERPAAVRLQALDALVAAGDPNLLVTVDGIFSTPRQSTPEFRGDLLASLGRYDSPKTAALVLTHYDRLEPQLQPRAIELLTQRTGWSRQLLAAIGKQEIPASALNLNQVRRLLATGDESLAEQVRKQWGSIRDERNPQRERIMAEMKEHIRATPGDPLAGEKVFKKVCAQCHKMYGEGAEVGPDITLNGRSSFDQLLSNVFDPSLVIGAAYQARTVVTTDGRVLTGLLAEDNPQRIVLKVQGGKLETIARDDVEILKTSNVSMMPEELEKQIKPQEMADLFAFITLDRHPSDPDARQLPGVRVIEPRSSTDPKQFAEILGEVAPGFSTQAVGEGGVALLREHAGRATVVQTHPLDRNRGCELTGKFTLPKGKQARLLLSVSHHNKGDWELRVSVNGQQALRTIVGPETTTDGWADLSVDLSAYAGQSVEIRLENRPNDWAYEFAYWGRAAVVTE